ncbi:MAG: DUF3656 domain-containing protein [Bacillota bacterium]|nr:DUF3656 domain-containing protein [Bacillota bacterium]
MMKAELLAPAGSYEGLQAVVKAGADAVYIGGSMFGARAYANNPQQEEMLEAIDYAHIHGKQIYLTVNTLLKNKELYGQLYDYLAPYYQQGIDAVIVQDLGVLSFLKKEFPNLPIHASTQMAVTGAKGAGLLKEAGVSRIVTARELSLKEIHEIYQETGMEIESFVHGALCYCYSGMCLFSSMLGGRSGNRGRCAQPCRLPYTAYKGKQQISQEEQAYLLSPKDMCTIDILPEILQAGVYSLKIEGRMKRPEYAAGVTSVYRKYLDLYEKNPKNYEVAAEDRQILLDLYQRDGFNQGYYHSHNGKEMMAVVNQKEQNKKQKIAGKRNEALFEQLKKEYLDTKKQEKINGNFILFANSPAILDLDFQDIHVQVMGDTVEEAMKQPLSADRVEKQMRKTGQTPFVFDTLEIMTDEAGFLPMQSINELRRKGLEELQREILKKYRRALPEKTENSRAKNGEVVGKNPVFYASVETKEQLEAVLEEKAIQGVYCHISMFEKKQLWKEAFEAMYQVQEKGKEFYPALPYMLRDGQLADEEQGFLKIAEQCEGFLVRNLEELGYLSKLGLLQKAVTDYSVYAFNDNAKNTLDAWGVLRTTVPLELNGKEIHARDNKNSEMIIYGHYPMMISAQCIKKTCGKCDKNSSFVKLKDRYGKYFPTRTFCDFCYNVIYNSVPTGLLEEAPQILGEGFASLRLNFTGETKEEVKNLLDIFIGTYGQENKNVKKKNPKEMPEFTKGHFKRGVE